MRSVFGREIPAAMLRRLRGVSGVTGDRSGAEADPESAKNTAAGAMIVVRTEFPPT
jgi:hypothetical protein